MSEDPPDPGPTPDEHTARLLAVVNLLAEMALQTLGQGEVDGARSFIDCIASLREKTKGNIGEAEDQLFETVLHQLRLAVIKGPPPAKEDAPAETPEPAQEERGGDAEPAG